MSTSSPAYEPRFFYRDLKGFDDFKGITATANFSVPPRDWFVVITDVKGSTRAIEEGRYKDVNMIGAAAIVSAHNALGDLEFPFVFGGDGATLLIPAAFRDEAVRELLALKRLSRQRFGLELRVGMVGVDEILAEGATLEVAKHTLVGRKTVAIFRGGGVSLAEHKVKHESDKYEIRDAVAEDTDLGRLSCRWRPIPAKRGKALSLLVAARGQGRAECYDRVLNYLEEVFEGRLDDANPIQLPQMSYHRFGECIRNEKRLHSSALSGAFLKRLGEIVLAVLVFGFGMHPLVFNPKRYANSMAAHSDYRKFDDMLRMILDCTAEQVEAIQEFLEGLHRSGEICYGMHTADTSLMTCFVDWLNDGEHIHFVDGGGGGYAMAAKGLKAQLACVDGEA